MSFFQACFLSPIGCEQRYDSIVFSSSPYVGFASMVSCLALAVSNVAAPPCVKHLHTSGLMLSALKLTRFGIFTVSPLLSGNDSCERKREP